MAGKRLGRLYTLATVLLVCVAAALVWTTVAFRYESATSLPALFKLRQAFLQPMVPDDIFIVTPYSERDFDTPEKLRDWDRREHAKAIDNLLALHVDVIVVDLEFRLEHANSEDAELAAAFSRAPSLVLNQIARPMQISSGGTSAHYLRNSVKPFPQSVSLMAPPLVPANSASVNRIPLFRSILYSSEGHQCYGFSARANSSEDDQKIAGALLQSRVVPTLALATLEQQILSDMRKSDAYMVWLQTHYKEQSSVRLACELMESLRSRVQNSGLDSFPAFQSDVSQRRLLLWAEVVSEQALRQLSGNTVATVQLNHLGPPETIHTLSYDELHHLARDVLENNKANPLQMATVFIGGSFVTPEDQKEDGFRTVYADSSRRMSGVEINATAYHSLRDNAGLRVVHGWVAMLLLLIVAVTVWWSASKLSMGWFAVVSAVSGTILMVSGFLSFAWFNVWLPLGMVASFFLVLVTLSVIWRFRFSSRERDRALQNLNSFVSETVAAQLDSGQSHVLKQAVCLVSDIRNFTRMGRTMDPGALHRANDAYFTELFNCVSAEGVDVVKTYGDSMTAVWLSGSDDALAAAVRAGLNILSISIYEEHRSKHDELETQLGLHRGEVAIGFVGSHRQKTVEVTGSTVYFASRLEQLNKQLGTKFLTTGALAESLQGCGLRHVGSATLKGYEDCVEVSEIYAESR